MGRTHFHGSLPYAYQTHLLLSYISQCTLNVTHHRHRHHHHHRRINQFQESTLVEHGGKPVTLVH